MKTTVEIRLGEERMVDYDFLASFSEMKEGETITAAADLIAVPTGSEPEDGLTIGSPAFSDTKSQAFVTPNVSTAQVGNKWLLKFPVTTNEGSKLVGECFVKIIS